VPNRLFPLLGLSDGVDFADRLCSLLQLLLGDSIHPGHHWIQRCFLCRQNGQVQDENKKASAAAVRFMESGVRAKVDCPFRGSGDRGCIRIGFSLLFSNTLPHLNRGKLEFGR